MNETDIPRLHNIKDTAKALSVTTRTVNRLVANKQIPSVKIGSRRLFNLARVVGALEAAGESSCG